MDQAFRDLNGNGKLDPYEDITLSIEGRVNNLLSQMTLEEKVGLMFQDIIRIEEDGLFNPDVSAFGRSTIRSLLNKNMTDFYLMGSASTRQMAEWIKQASRNLPNRLALVFRLPS